MLFRLKNYHEFSRFFLCDQTYRFRNISQTSELKSTTANVSASTRFTYFDGLCNYLNLFPKQWILLPWRHLLLLSLVVLVLVVVVVVVVVMVVVVIVQVAAVVVVNSWPELVKNKLEARASKYRFGPRAAKHKVGTRAGKHIFGARTVKYKLGTRAGKYKSGARASKYKLGARAGARGQGCGPGTSKGLGASKYKHPFFNITNNFFSITQLKQ